MFFFLLGVIFCVLVYYKLIRPCGYWKNKGIAHVPSWPLMGSLSSVVLRKKHLADASLDIYNRFPNERCVGYMQFTSHHLLLRDLELIQQVGVKDFNFFHDRPLLGNFENDPILSKSLIALTGLKWEEMRASLSPVFATNQLRAMYSLIEERAQNFANDFQTEVEVEGRDFFCKYANDIIASIAFGLQIDSIQEPQNEFFSNAMVLNNSTTWQSIKSIMSRTVTDRIELVPKYVMAYFVSIITDTLRKREDETSVRPDLINFLIEARRGNLKLDTTKQEKIEGFATVEETEIDSTMKPNELTDDFIIAQIILFFLAGFDTVANASLFMAYELAVNPDIQKKLQEEIDAVSQKYNNKVPFEVLVSMKYLDQVVSETLRLWPPVFQVDRICTKNYQIQSTTPEEKPLLVEKGVTVVIPIKALHEDPQYFPEPNRFDPERFNVQNRAKIIPGTYLPFGLGPRNCIGSRLALVEIKTLFFHLLSKFEVAPIGKTVIPVKISPKAFSLVPENGLWLGLNPRKSKSS